jgi:hypothetical protein
MYLSKFARVLAGAAAAAVLTLAGTSIAAATSHGDPQPPGSHSWAPQTVSPASLCQNLWAVVNADASLARAGCPNTTTQLLGTGAYQVTFPRDITGCAFLATVGLSTFFGSTPPGMVTVVGRAGTNNTLYIVTSDKTGVPTPLGFHVSVQCPPSHRHGRVKIPAGKTTATVSVPGGISSASVALATIQNNVSVSVQSAVPSTSAGTITIHLTKTASKTVVVGWSVVD